MIAEEIMEIHRQVISLAAFPTSAQHSTLPLPGASQCVETSGSPQLGRRLLLITQATKTRDAAYTHMGLLCSSGLIQNRNYVLNKEARPNRPEQKTLLGKSSSQHFECIPGSFLVRMKPLNIQVWSKLRAASDLDLSQSASSSYLE